MLSEYAGLVVKTIPEAWVEDLDTRVNIPKTVYEDLKGLARLRRTARSIVQQWQQNSDAKPGPTA